MSRVLDPYGDSANTSNFPAPSPEMEYLTVRYYCWVTDSLQLALADNCFFSPAADAIHTQLCTQPFPNRRGIPAMPPPRR